MLILQRRRQKRDNDVNITDDVDGECPSDRSQLVANQTRVVAVVGQVRIDQSN